MRKPAICPATVRQSTASSAKLVAANAGKHVIAFTHKPVLGDDPVAVENRRLIAMAVEAGFTVNLSADNPAHADQLARSGSRRS